MIKHHLSKIYVKSTRVERVKASCYYPIFCVVAIAEHPTIEFDGSHDRSKHGRGVKKLGLPSSSQCYGRNFRV